MESGRKIEAGESNTHPSSSTGEVGISTPSKKLSSSLSSSSDSSNDSSFELIVNVPDQFISGTSDSLKRNEFAFANADGLETRPPSTDLSSAAKTTRLSSSSASESSPHDHVIELSKPTDNVESRKDLQTSSSECEHKVKLQQSGESSSSEVATQYPPAQLMERVDEDPTSTGYRFPSHVFSRTKSTSPMDQWSATSNESLFSIHMGNMSFTREQLSWMGKSGELYMPGESPLYASQPSNMVNSDCGLKGSQANGDMAATEARAAETMREVIRENFENQLKETSTLTESASQTTTVSLQSEGSTKSFQFPILAGNGGKSISLKGGNPVKAKEEPTTESTQPASNPSPKEPSSDESLKAAANVGPKRWFSCFSCCQSCS